LLPIPQNFTIFQILIDVSSAVATNYVVAIFIISCVEVYNFEVSVLKISSVKVLYIRSQAQCQRLTALVIGATDSFWIAL
jgi:hypothetical protein